MNRIRSMAHYQCDVDVRRVINGTNPITFKTSSDNLVPGDIFLVPQSTKMPCDAILLSGLVIVNESMLTGESIPVFKTSIPNNSESLYSPVKDTQHTLYSGTQVIQ